MRRPLGAAFSRGAVETHPTLEYHKKGDVICGGPLVVEAPDQHSVVELWRPTLP